MHSPLPYGVLSRQSQRSYLTSSARWASGATQHLSPAFPTFPRHPLGRAQPPSSVNAVKFQLLSKGFPPRPRPTQQASLPSSYLQSANILCCQSPLYADYDLLIPFS